MIERNIDDRPFAGIRVFDATQGVAGPHATMLLALNGADVIKVEPVEGDWCRVLGKTIAQESVNFYSVNRGKRSVAYDAKSDAGRQIAERLGRSCDIFVESFRPGVAAKMGLGYEAMAEHNPALIYASVSGFGQRGPYSRRPTVDGLIQAYSGLMVMNKTEDGKPYRIAMIVVDVLTGLYAYQAIASTFVRRLRFGRGAFLDINMLQAAAAFQAAKIMEFVESDGKPAPLYVPAGMFGTADGYIVVSGMRDQHFAALCGVIGRSELSRDPRWPTQQARVDHGDEINRELRKEFAKEPTDYWLKALHDAGVFAEKVRSYGDWLQEEQVRAMGAYSWVDHDAFGRLPVAHVPGILPGGDRPSADAAPLLGEHSRSILRDLGFSEEWIAQQVASGAVRETERKEG
ncbi:CoA transferase [Ramlibacter sp. RBP-2]|uniref:CoA transferase n=1 Tax=Ramlibacter lithotrophicus TaxID=2606681 RepID=A0A7X6DKM3_9BURK|nr:CoA transferase [Ramlibacter lithotrophicus]NKE68900.1 CoA transferase [Ramlibacter lithotrophicus]